MSSNVTLNVGAQVVETLPNGILVVQATRDLLVGNDRQTVILRGLVRPGDIAGDNSIFSSQVSNLQVELKGKGAVAEATRQPNIGDLHATETVYLLGEPMFLQQLRFAARRILVSTLHAFLCVALTFQVAASSAFADDPSISAASGHIARIKDVTTVEGVRDNMLIGYGLVVGLKRTGDSQQTQFSTQTLANILERMGVQIPVASVQIRNVAAVFVTATLPPFARPGTRIDVTVSSIGDAKIHRRRPAAAHCAALFGRSGLRCRARPARSRRLYRRHAANSTTVNHPTVGRIP